MTDNEKEAEDTTKFEELKESWVNDEIDTLTYVAVLHNRIETLEGQLTEAMTNNERLSFLVNRSTVDLIAEARQEVARECYRLVSTFAIPDIVFVLNMIKARFKLGEGARDE